MGILIMLQNNQNPPNIQTLDNDSISKISLREITFKIARFMENGLFMTAGYWQ